MADQAMLIRRGQVPSLNVMGAGVQFLCDSDATGGAWSLMEVLLPKHSGPPPHDHDWDEAYYVLSGEVSFSINEQLHSVSAGDFVYAPGGTVLSFHGLSDQPARVLIFDAPGHAGSFFKEVDQQVKRLPDDLSKVPGIGERHGVRFKMPKAA